MGASRATAERRTGGGGIAVHAADELLAAGLTSLLEARGVPAASIGSIGGLDEPDSRAEIVI